MVGGGEFFIYVWSVAGYLGGKDTKREREFFGKQQRQVCTLLSLVHWMNNNKEKMESKIWEQWLPGITIGASGAKQPVDNSIKIKIKYKSAKYCSTIYA